MKIPPVLKRYEGNPILCPHDMPFSCSAVFNAGAVRHGKEYVLLLRVEDLSRSTNFHVARSNDGYHFAVDSLPINYPLRPLEKKYGSHRFDARITPLNGMYYICHALWLGQFGSVCAMARTADFRDFEPLSISVPSNRNAVLFPEMIGGRYARLERPQNIDGSGRVWVSYSKDLAYWGDSEPIDLPITNWAMKKSGAGIVPIKTPHGWLEIYHATVMTASTENYYLGAALLDIDNPAKVIAAPTEFILAAERDYECVGQVPNVVFTSGAVETDDHKLLIYYGGADTRICVAESSVDALVEFCLATL